MHSHINKFYLNSSRYFTAFAEIKGELKLSKQNLALTNLISK